jgi:multiple sugar transport system permease protein
VAVITTVWGVLVAAWSAYGFARFEFLGKWPALVFVLLAQSFPRILLIIPYLDGQPRAHARYLPGAHPRLQHVHPAAVFVDHEGLRRATSARARRGGAGGWLQPLRRVLAGYPAAAAARPGRNRHFGFLTAWNEYEFALVLTRTDTVRTISVALNYFLGEFTTKWNNIMAAAALATLPVVIIFLFLQRQLVQVADWRRCRGLMDWRPE